MGDSRRRTSRPFFPSTTTSSIPGNLEAATALPHDMASNNDKASPFVNDGIVTRNALDTIPVSSFLSFSLLVDKGVSEN